MITENHYAAQEIARWIDQKIDKLKDQLATPKMQDAYTDQVLLWSTVGQIKGLKDLRNELIRDDE